MPSPHHLPALGATLAGLTLLLLPSAHGNEQIELFPRPAAGAQQVAFELELGGELLVPGEEPAADPQRLPLEATARIVYDECQASTQPASGVRYYHEARSTSDVAGRKQVRALRDQRRLVTARLQDSGVQFAAIHGPFERNELDLIAAAGDSLALPGLLPADAVKLGDSWSPTPAAMQCLTGLDSVGICEVSIVLAEANARFARCQLGGVVHGVTRGASTELELDGVFLFDRLQGQITRFNFAMRENREVGAATPGLDAVSKMRVEITAAKPDTPLAQATIEKALASQGFEPQPLQLRSTPLAFVTYTPRHWFPTAELGDSMTLRLVRPEGLVAHANLKRLDPRPLDPRTALAEFRSDVLSALGKAATGVAAEEQWTNQHGCRVMSIKVAGQVNDTPVQWHAYQIAPPEELVHQSRLALTFTVETAELGQLADEDRQLVDQVQLLDGGRQAHRGSLQK